MNMILFQFARVGSPLDIPKKGVKIPCISQTTIGEVCKRDK